MPSHPQLDEHGFPIPATFDDDVPRRPRGQRFTGAARTLLVLAFIGLLAGWTWKSDLTAGAKRMMARRAVSDAIDKYYKKGDVPGALADLDRAIGWAPRDAMLYRFRAEIKVVQGDVAGGLADLNELIRLSPHDAEAYLLRSQAYQRLDRHRDAIDDLTKAIHLSPPRDPMPRNNRAYARAIANIEIDEALVDAQQALDLIEHDLADAQRGLNGRFDDGETAKLNGQKAAYLDTRGYIYYLQDNQEAAQADLNQAIELTHACHERRLATGPLALQSAIQKQCDHELAVMYHHRGLVYQKLGRADEAKSDLDQGDRLGYNPAAGVF